MCVCLVVSFKSRTGLVDWWRGCCGWGGWGLSLLRVLVVDATVARDAVVTWSSGGVL